MYSINILPKYLYSNILLYINKKTIVNIYNKSINLWLQYHELTIRNSYMLLLSSSSFKLLKLKLYNITDEDLKYIPNIEDLDINSNITDKGLKYISNIKILNIYLNTNITDIGLNYISNMKTHKINHKQLVYFENIFFLK